MARITINCYGSACPQITVNNFWCEDCFMALPDYLKVALGTAVIWGEAGATGVTKTLTFEALAAAAARMGEYADLGATFDEEHMVFLIIETGTAPAAGGLVKLHFVCTDDTSRWPAKVTGSDAAYTRGTSDANLNQAGLPVVSLFATNDANTILRQDPVVWRPSGRYVVPIIANDMSQAVRDETTATDNDSRVILVPRRFLMQDDA